MGVTHEEAVKIAIEKFGTHEIFVGNLKKFEMKQEEEQNKIICLVQVE